MKIKRKKPSAKKRLLTALVSFLAVVFVLLLSGTIYMNWLLGRMYVDPSTQETLSAEQIEQLLQNQGETMDPTAEVVDPDELVWEEVDKITSGKHVINILLVGQDRRPNEPRARSDVMMLVTVNTKTKQVTMTSFLRDLYVKIPGWRSNRLNIPYAVGGYELLADTLEINFGIRPDKFVEVDFNGFKDIVDLVGGVDMELTEKEANHLNWNERMYGFEDEEWELKAGKNHLTGSQALAYARIRKIDATGDFARTERQRKVITALLQNAKNLDLVKINSLLLEMTEMITTDMTPSEILSYAKVLYPVLTDMGEINSLHIPAGNHFYSVNVEGIGYVIVPNLEKNSEVIAEYQK